MGNPVLHEAPKKLVGGPHTIRSISEIMIFQPTLLCLYADLTEMCIVSKFQACSSNGAEVTGGI